LLRRRPGRLGGGQHPPPVLDRLPGEARPPSASTSDRAYASTHSVSSPRRSGPASHSHTGGSGCGPTTRWAAARHRYLAAGFVLTASGPHRSFGVDLVGQTYELDLADRAAAKS
jgi:hypothetical protein